MRASFGRWRQRNDRVPTAQFNHGKPRSSSQLPLVPASKIEGMTWQDAIKKSLTKKPPGGWPKMGRGWTFTARFPGKAAPLLANRRRRIAPAEHPAAGAFAFHPTARFCLKCILRFGYDGVLRPLSWGKRPPSFALVCFSPCPCGGWGLFRRRIFRTL